MIRIAPTEVQSNTALDKTTKVDKRYHVLLLGQVGAGKTSLINTVQSALIGRIFRGGMPAEDDSVVLEVKFTLIHMNIANERNTIVTVL